jgi:hypothetical protein
MMMPHIVALPHRFAVPHIHSIPHIHAMPQIRAVPQMRAVPQIWTMAEHRLISILLLFQNNGMVQHLSKLLRYPDVNPIKE